MKFLVIFHSNLDEFFMIRALGHLHQQLEASVAERSADGLAAPEQLRLASWLSATRASPMPTLRR